jgi:EAL domain-containing protein (putative c-di-GMP-specific phosphodiesterase class I)
VNSFGYRYGQGYLFARPLTAAAFAEILEPRPVIATR